MADQDDGHAAAERVGLRLFGAERTNYRLGMLRDLDPGFARLFEQWAYAGLYDRGVLGGDDRADVATRGELAAHPHPAWANQLHQVVQDAIDRRLVEHVLPAIAVEVQLQRLELDDRAVRDVADADGGEVRVPRART